MAASSSSMGGISYRVSNLQQSVDFYTKVFGMRVVENSAQSTSAKLILDTVEEGQSAITIELLGGFTSGAEIGDVSNLQTLVSYQK